MYEAAPPAWRIGAHERVAARLEQRGADAVARAFHVARSARPSDERSIALLLEAADQSAGRAPETAATWRAAALRLLPGEDLGRRAALLAALAADQSDAGRLANCRASLLEAMALTPDDLELAAACAAVEQFLGASAQARKRLRAAVTRATPEQRPLVELELATTAYFGRDAAELLEHATATETLLGARGVAARALAGIAHLWQSGRDAAESRLDEAAVRFDELDDQALGAYPQAALYLGLAQCLAERFRIGVATLARGVEVVRSARRGGLLPVLLCVRGLMRWYVLELDGSVSDLEAAKESSRLLGLVTIEHLAVSGLTHAYVERGEPVETARAVAAFERIDSAAETTLPGITARCDVAATLLTTDPERCIREMVAVGGPSLEHVDPSWSTWQLGVLVRAAIAVGRLDDAQRWAEIAQQRAHGRELPVGAARGAIAGAEVLLARGEPARAVTAARDALARAEHADGPYETLESRLVLGRALAADSQTQEAIELLEGTLRQATTTMAVRIRDAAAQQLRELGVRVPGSGRRAISTTTALSPREQEIAELVAVGSSNREVAAALFLSEKTVEYHLSHAYAKLGVRSRVELVGTLTSTATA